MIMKQRKANMIGRNSTARSESNFEGADVESGLISEKPIRTMRPRQHRQQSCRLPMLCFGLMVGTFVYCQMLRSFSSNASFQYLRQSNTFVVPKYTEPFNHDNIAFDATHLVMVACHSTLVGANIQDAAWDETTWHILDYQRGQGLPQAIVAHIQAGIVEAQRDPNALLIFSGGETRSDGTGPWSESSSYFRVADTLALWQTTTNSSSSSITDVRSRTVTEEFATDSFENLMFSICRFKEVTGSYPQKNYSCWIYFQGGSISVST